MGRVRVYRDGVIKARQDRVRFLLSQSCITNIDLNAPLVYEFDYSLFGSVKNATLTYHNGGRVKIVNHPIKSSVIGDPYQDWSITRRYMEGSSNV